MEPIFSRDGHVVGWLKDSVVYDEVGKPRAVIRGNAVIGFGAEYLGRLTHGYFRDQHGDAVAFTRGAQGKPIMPSPRVVPEPPGRRVSPPVPDVRVLPEEILPTVFWSELDWIAYLTSQAIIEEQSRGFSPPESAEV